MVPNAKISVNQENQRSVRVMVPNAKISVISRKSKGLNMIAKYC
jgi:hypothetical protein